jgi:hypothetical protein
MNRFGKILYAARMFSERWGDFCFRQSSACVKTATADVSKTKIPLHPNAVSPTPYEIAWRGRCDGKKIRDEKSDIFVFAESGWRVV